MQRSELLYDLPGELIAQIPKEPCRILSCLEDRPEEFCFQSLIDRFQSGDVLVINDSKVIPQRVESLNGTLFTFIRQIEGTQNWQVLFPAKKAKLGDCFELPGGLSLTLIEKGRPQIVETNRNLTEAYFSEFGMMALPPYILEARGNDRSWPEDNNWYQTFFAEQAGSAAAPTASLHFSESHFESLKNKGVEIVPITLHVGLGTFLPIKSEDLSHHEMHSEWVHIPQNTLEVIMKARSQKNNIWALGTTVTRSLESLPKLTRTSRGYTGETDLFIKPGFQFQFVDRLLTNFHQPGSTLISLVMAFSSPEKVKKAYQWAIDRKFRFLSYGDLTVWSNDEGL